MKKLIYIFLVLSLITIMGCNRSVDKRLVLADTLMWTNPDSSLAILNAINRDSLTSKEDLAYHALLLTQAQFRCNIPLTSDTLISKAVDYYRDNHNREHYTRALLYKGGAYEDMGKPVEAMKWYKQAEDNADSTDYRNLAQINMRMGTVYYRSYASNGIDTEKFRKSYKYYKCLGDKQMTMIAIHRVGNLYRGARCKEAISLLNKGAELAKEIRDTNSYYLILSDLSMAFFMDSCFGKAKEIAMKCYENDGKYATNLVHFDAANAYAELNMADSARFYLNLVDLNSCSQFDRMLYAYAQSRVFKAEDNEAGAIKQENLGNSIKEEIIVESKRNQLFETESKEESRIIQEKDTSISSIKWRAMVVSFISFFLFIILGYYVYKNIKYKQFVDDLKQNQLLAQSLINELKNKANNGDVKSEEGIDVKVDNPGYDVGNERMQALSNYLYHYYDTINDLLHKCNKVPREEFVKEFKKTIISASKDNYYWDVTRLLANEKSGNLVTRLCDEHDDLIEAEIRIICLMCQGYKNNTISLITGYGVNSIKSIKTRIKNKIGISIPLDAFVREEVLKEKHKAIKA